ncbi:MAG: YHS domain-containing (seleno)protein [Caulobacter sp.]|nr:YHS domain-containing (seleno)protein [Caulobacter sp.]
MKPIALALAALALTGPLMAPGLAAAAKPAVYTPALSNVAVGGYDTVAYFTQGKPVRGLDSFQTDWNGATWKFSTAANLAKFKARPTAYAPQYGGYCAWAVANNYTAKGDPTQWRIVGGKLYLNYNAEVQGKWVKDIPGYIAKGDANWPKVIK